MDREPGLSVRMKLTLSYAAFLMIAGALLLAVVWVFLLRYVPDGQIMTLGAAVPNRDDLVRAFAPAVAWALAFLLGFGLLGGWIQLRTPLAITQTLLDVARRDPNGNAELVEHLAAVSSRAIELTEALLVLSRADQRSFTREDVDLSLLAEEAAETLLPLAEKHGVTIETSGDIAPTIGSQALLLQMTTNLLHNAIVHNLSEHGTVQINIASRPDSVALIVENTDDRLASHLVSTLTEPFQRGTGRIRTHGRVSASASPSSRASPRHTMEPSPLRRWPLEGSASRCSCLPHPRNQLSQRRHRDGSGSGAGPSPRARAASTRSSVVSVITS